MAKPNWIETWKQVLDVAFDELGLHNNPIGQQVFADIIILNFLELAMGETQEWSEFRGARNRVTVVGGHVVPHPHSAYLSPYELLLIRVRWLAVHLAVELADWYPWSISDFGEDGIRQLVRARQFPITLNWKTTASSHSGFLGDVLQSLDMVATDEEKLGALLGMTAFATECMLPVVTAPEGAFVDNIFRNPSEPCLFAHKDLYGQSLGVPGGLQWSFTSSNPLDNAYQAVCSLIEWFHGPANTYTASDPLQRAGTTFAKTVAFKTLEQFADKCMTLGLDEAPFEIVDTVRDGRQAWVHGDISFNCALKSWYISRKFYAEYGESGGEYYGPDYALLSRLKIGGCQEAGRFFAATLAAMNVPVVTGNPMFSMGVAFPDDAKTFGYRGAHFGLWLPWRNVALEHADLLWGPGASLFPAEKLFINADVVLAPGKMWFNALGNGVFVEPGVAYGDLCVDWPTIGQKDPRGYFAQIWQSGMNMRYAVSRTRWEAFLSAGWDSRYAQVVADGALYECAPYEMWVIPNQPPKRMGGVGIFERLNLFLSRCQNPIMGLMLPEFDSANVGSVSILAVQPSVVLDEWGESVPADLRVEPGIITLLSSLVAELGLGGCDKYSVAIMIGGKYV